VHARAFPTNAAVSAGHLRGARGAAERQLDDVEAGTDRREASAETSAHKSRLVAAMMMTSPDSSRAIHPLTSPNSTSEAPSPAPAEARRFVEKSVLRRRLNSPALNRQRR
jgi:hypothetical protein